MSGSKIESGLQLFSRLNQRPSVEKLNPVLFSNDGPFPNEFVEITGSAGSGKTLLVTDLLTRCLLPTQYNGITLPGKNCGAIMINTDHHFDVLKLIGVMELTLRKHCDKVNKLSQISLENIIKASLSNLIVLNCYDSYQLQMTFLNLEKILSENTNVGLVVLDSIFSYYWEYRNNNGIISLQSYYMKLLKSLQNNVRNSNVVLVVTRSEIDSKSKNVCPQATYRIVLEKREDFHAIIIHKNIQKTVRYVIEDTINFVD